MILGYLAIHPSASSCSLRLFAHSMCLLLCPFPARAKRRGKEVRKHSRSRPHRRRKRSERAMLSRTLSFCSGGKNQPR